MANNLPSAPTGISRRSFCGQSFYDLIDLLSLEPIAATPQKRKASGGPPQRPRRRTPRSQVSRSEGRNKPNSNTQSSIPT
jgi:hypothetical protein